MVRIKKLNVCFISGTLSFSLQETETGTINLAFDGETVQSILNYCYTGEQNLSKSNVVLLYQAAHMLNITPLIKMCEEYLETEISKENCLGIWKTSQVLGRSDMAGVAKVIVLQSFAELYSVDAFDKADLSIEDLKTLLGDPFINCSPSIKCSASLIWLMLQENLEKGVIFDLFMYLVTSCGVNVDNLRESFIETNSDIWSNFTNESETMVRRKTFQELIGELPTKMASVCSEKFQSRHDEGLVIIGGTFLGSRTFMMTLNLRDHKWYCLKQLPEDPGFNFAICCSGTSLYLTGGSKRNNQFLQYDIVENAWNKLTNLPVGRDSHGMVGFDSALYMFGGCTNPPACVAYVEMYIPEDRSWRKVGELAKPVKHTSYCVLEDKIYMFGGSIVGDDAPSNLAQCYDTRDNLSWYLQFKLPIKSKASTLLAIAGTREVYLLHKGVIYTMNPRKSVQEVLSLSNGPRKGAGAVSYGEQILIVGGEDDNMEILDRLILFDPVTNDATPLPYKVPWPVTSFHFSKIKIPSALVHGLAEVCSTGGAIPAIGY